MSAHVRFRPLAAGLALLAGVGGLPGLAPAADRPATADGAAKVQAFFDRFLPAPAAGAAPLVKVKPDGEDYLATVDLGAVNGFIKGAGGDASYEPATLAFRIFEQDDGKWRVAMDTFPKVVSHVKDVTSVAELRNYRQTIVIDPAIAWFVSGAASADGGTVATKAPTVNQTFDFGPLKADYATSAGPDGSVSSTVKEEIAAIAFKFSGISKDGGASVNTSGRLDRASFNVGVDGLKSRKLFDLLSFVSSHRTSLADHEAEVKDLMRPLAAPGLRFVEGGEASKLLISLPQGAVALSDVKLAIGASNAGPDSAIDATIVAEGLSLPAGVLPPNATELTPSKIDLAMTLKGIDIAAAANQAIDAMHFGGDGPAISQADSAKVSTALIGAGPLRLVLSPSHIAAPALDVDFDGELRYAVGKPTGAATVRMRGFDKTMEAVKSLGADMAQQSLPALAMAKGLAKNESDGSLSWRIEVGDDRSITINGIPLGKAPQ
jgi:hypothetical protein